MNNEVNVFSLDLRNIEQIVSEDEVEGLIAGGLVRRARSGKLVITEAGLQAAYAA